MKKFALVLTVAALALMISSGAQAQGKMGASVGLEVLLPLGTFGDAAKIGIGGTGQFDYLLNPNIALTGKIGYITWGAKTGDTQGAVEASFSGIPILVGGKYYFQPAGKTRFYGQFELGFFIMSVSTKVNVPGFVSSDFSASSTEFTVCPAVGVEIPAGPKGAVDISARFWGILSSGGSSNIGLRAGYKFLF